MNKLERNKILKALVVPLAITALCWIIWLIDSTGHYSLYKFGIYPRKISGLIGIITGPLVHADDDIAHIVNNSYPLLFLGWALFYFYEAIAIRILALIWLITGFWVWVAADQAYHIGISGVLYGLLTFLFYSGVIRKNKNLLGLTLLVTFMYGGMVWGVLPYDITISWQSHLFGAVAGIILAWYFRKQGPQSDRIEWPEETEPPYLLREDGTKDYDYWKTEEQRKNEEGKSNKEELKINYEYKKNDKSEERRNEGTRE